MLDDGNTAQGIALRGVAELSADSRIALAEKSEPLWVVAKNADDTLTSIIAEQCGEQPEKTHEYLIEQGLAFNAVDDAGMPFAPGDAVAVPFCFRVDERVSVTVQNGDTPSEILKREYGVFGSRTTQRFFEINKSLAYPDFTTFAKALRPGDEVFVPYASELRVLYPRSPGNVPLEEILASVSEDSVRDQLSMSVAPVRNDPENDRFRLRIVENVELTGADPAIACNGSEGEIARIVDLEMLRTRFAAETAKLAELLGETEPEILPSTVGLVDSGLATIGDDFFDKRFFLANRDELIGTPGVDDEDENDLVDDIYGRNYHGNNHDVLSPLPSAPRAAHGTKMAALVLGGLDLAPNWTLSFDKPVVTMKVISFVDGDPFNSFGTANAVELPGAIEYLEKTHANIVNLSLVTEERIAGLKNSIRKAEDLLFVVAAGNARSGPGDDLQDFKLYPARFGGDRGEPNLVTVGAHDLSGARAGFSHFSEKYVDLLAPGCAVQTRDHQRNIVLDNGTSPATALVSFTAALVRALGVQQPGRIKLRLLTGTDFDPSLSSDAFSSGRLNIIKAISLHHDIVELRKDGTLLFGVIRNHRNVIHACMDVPTVNGHMHKVVANIGATPELEIWSDIDQEMNRKRCKQRDESFSILFEDETGIRQIPIADIKEIVFGARLAR